jgi:amino acid permease
LCGAGQWVECGGGCYKYICTHLQFFFFFSLLPSATTICNHPTLQQSNRKMSKVTNYAILVCFSVYLFMGVFGYFHYGNDTKGNVLQNCFPTKDPMVVLSFGTSLPLDVLDVLCTMYLYSQHQRQLWRTQ